MKKIFCFTLMFSILFLSVSAQPDDRMAEDEVFKAAEKNIELYRKGDVTIKIMDENGIPLKGATLKIDQQRHDFMFGALLFDLRTGTLEPEEEVLFKKHFLTLFNYGILPFYWNGYENEPGHPSYDRLTGIVEWCMENRITPKGHPLALTHPAGTPEWVMDMSLEDSELMLESRILENVAGFPEIEIWDVVNEPVHTVTWEMAHADKEAELRYNDDVPLLEIANWVEGTYKAAHRAGPEKQLVLNEFLQIADPASRKRFYDLVVELRRRETPIDGLGVQAHEPREEWYDPVDVWETLELYRKFGLPLHITEFSPQSKGAEITGDYKSGNWTEETQAEFTEMMYRLSFGHPAVASINWWGFSDANAWLPGCGITDEELNPKPVFHTLNRLINEEWMTRGVELKTNRTGASEFRGFYGEYQLEVTTKDGKKKSAVMQLEKGEKNVWEVNIE